MEADIYQAPEADLQQEEAVSNEFYVVSKSKFLILYVTTCGLYEVYWFYRNWSLYKQANNVNMWPVMRAIFSVFFAHSLFRNIDIRVEYSKTGYKWSPEMMAGIYVILSIAGIIAGWVSTSVPEYSILDFVSLITFPMTIWVLYKAQTAINIACDDPEGESNAQLAPANYLWIAIGLAFWALVGFGLYEAFVGASL
ncbi:hypothetical protein [Microbulbifer sp.]|uniref:hypothetical protein n=1 Tax=Microbulbifer sp. TaxID=1908541 RepID=UPI003F40FB88